MFNKPSYLKDIKFGKFHSNTLTMIMPGGNYFRNLDCSTLIYIVTFTTQLKVIVLGKMTIK